MDIDPESFAIQTKRMPDVRNTYKAYENPQVHYPQPTDKGWKTSRYNFIDNFSLQRTYMILSPLGFFSKVFRKKLYSIQKKWQV
jgi:hypothetical protein